MKKIYLVFFFVAVVCTGCATQYSLVLTNGDIITARGRPVYNQERGRYYYKDGSGQPSEISASRVREVAPSSMVDKGGARFLK